MFLHLEGHLYIYILLTCHGREGEGGREGKREGGKEGMREGGRTSFVELHQMRSHAVYV
jgi:hypothetical protein